MCGLYGWVRQENSKPRYSTAWSLASALSWLNDDRGGDSWGFAGDGLDRPVKGLKGAFDMKEKHATTMASRRWLLAHTRKATTGAVSRANAHPFVVGGVTGAHNGMVTNHTELNAEYGRDCAVDSMHIFYHIDGGIGTFADIEAYGAVTFACQGAPGEVFLGRFNGGELSVADVPGFGLVWSSSARHLRAALKTAGLRRARWLALAEGRTYIATPRGLQSCGLELDFADPWGRWKKYDLMARTGMATADADDLEVLLHQEGMEALWQGEDAPLQHRAAGRR